jgi:SWI/SNF-related matrix-associated actin-dependent regulator of chromatin subfamily A member 5
MVLIEKGPLMRVPFDYVIVDEAHRMKNDKSKLAVTLRKYKSRHRFE